MLNIISSANAKSRQAHSFVIVSPGKFLPSGIKHNAKKDFLTLQIPFIVELKDHKKFTGDFQWIINIPRREFGKLNILSNFEGSYINTEHGFLWSSTLLDRRTYDRHKLIFRPEKFIHQPTMYKKGRGRSNLRRTYGGGSTKINDQPYNPRYKYEITLRIIDSNNNEKYTGIIEMDNKDMIRQEYINHFNIPRYGRGSNGNLAIPKRDEITHIPKKIQNLSGNPLTESRYKLLIDDGMSQLAQHIVDQYQASKTFYTTNPLKDTQGNKLIIPDSKLWLSSGWRNPERNEWYSNALNGIHQRGGAIDIIIKEPPGSIKSAIAYWVLWLGLQKSKTMINAYWQLETNGRPMRTDEFKNDIEPKNGIPDAFDKADHLHANIKYRKND